MPLRSSISLNLGATVRNGTRQKASCDGWDAMIDAEDATIDWLRTVKSPTFGGRVSVLL